MNRCMYIMGALSLTMVIFLFIAIGYCIGWEAGRPKVNPDDVINPATDTIIQPPLCDPSHDYYQPPHNVLP